MSDNLRKLEALFQEHGPRLRAWLKRRIPALLARRLDPEDVLQDAFALARSKFAAFKAQSVLPAYPWLYGVVRDCYHRQWQRHTRTCRDPQKELPWPEQSSAQLGLGLIAPGGTPSETLVHEDLRRQVVQVVEKLSAADKELLAMRYWEGFAFAEIAAILQLTENAARVRHARALRRFHDLWQRLGSDAVGPA